MTFKNAFSAALLLAGGLLATVSTTLAQQAGEVVSLRSEFKRGQCLTMAPKGYMADCTTDNSQKITLVRMATNQWQLKVGSLCVLPAPESDPVKLASCSHRDAKWSFNSSGQIKSTAGKCLHIWARGGTNPKVTTNNCTGQKNQKWARYQPLSPEGTTGAMSRAMISPKSAPGKCLDLANRRTLVIWDCHGGNNQRLSFTWGTRTQIRIDGLCLMPENVAGQSSAVIPVTCNNDRTAQLWHAGTDGRIRDALGRCLDLKGNSLRNGTPMIAYPCQGTQNQQFYPR